MGEIDNEDFPILMQKKKNIVDIIEEYKLKIPIQDFFQICNRNEVEFNIYLYLAKVLYN